MDVVWKWFPGKEMIKEEREYLLGEEDDWSDLLPNMLMTDLWQ